MRPNLPANSSAINYILIFIIICSQSRRHRKNEGRRSFQWLAILYPSPNTTNIHNNTRLPIHFHMFFNVFVWCRVAAPETRGMTYLRFFGCVHFGPHSHTETYQRITRVNVVQKTLKRDCTCRIVCSIPEVQRMKRNKSNENRNEHKTLRYAKTLLEKMRSGDFELSLGLYGFFGFFPIWRCWTVRHSLVHRWWLAYALAQCRAGVRAVHFIGWSW